MRIVWREKPQKKNSIFALIQEILHAWRESMREIMSRRETHAECMRVDSPAYLDIKNMGMRAVKFMILTTAILPYEYKY